MNIMDSDRAFRAAARGNSSATEMSAAVNSAQPPTVAPGATKLIKRVERGADGSFAQFFMTDDEIQTLNAGKTFASPARTASTLLQRQGDAPPVAVGRRQSAANICRAIAEGNRAEISELAQSLRKAQIGGDHGGEIGRIGPNIMLFEAAKTGNVHALKILRDLMLADYSARQAPIPDAYYYSLPHMTQYLKTQPQRRVKPLFNPRITDAAGLTARDHAALSGSRETVSYLDAWAPPVNSPKAQSFAQIIVDQSLQDIRTTAAPLIPRLAPQAHSMPSPFDQPPSVVAANRAAAEKPNHSF